MKEYRDTSGRLSIALSDDDRQFELCAKRLEKFGGRLRVQLDGSDHRSWEFEVKGVTLVLLSDPMAGVSLRVEDGRNDDLLRRAAAACLGGK